MQDGTKKQYQTHRRRSQRRTVKTVAETPRKSCPGGEPGKASENRHKMTQPREKTGIYEVAE
jgi:hypothetical protein